MQFMLDVSIIEPPPGYENICWHNAAEILWRWRQREYGFEGPMNTLAHSFERDLHLPAPTEEFLRFIEIMGLTPLMPQASVFFSRDFAPLLQRYGPLLCLGGFTPYGPDAGHIIVVIGVNTDFHTVFYVDGVGPYVTKSAPISWFNSRLHTDIRLDPRFDCIYHIDPARPI